MFNHYFSKGSYRVADFSSEESKETLLGVVEVLHTWKDPSPSSNTRRSLLLTFSGEKAKTV